MDKLQDDPWRREVGFTPSLQQALDAVLNPAATDEQVTATLNEWISRHQPCLFGRIAAKAGLLSYCILREDDLRSSDELVERKIQSARQAWTRLGFEGKASGFIVIVLSPTLATATPEESVKQIALRVCSLYLQEEVQPDQMHHDRIYLEQPGNRRTTWEWLAGVNYFSAQGDQRWWQDHRFPAGLAFSVNSVGHMVKSGKLLQAMHHLEEVMGTAPAEFRNPKVDALEKAIELAMRTIALASNGPSGKATSLIPRLRRGTLPKCPVELPRDLAIYNHCTYHGYYHTDFTIPSEYFLPDAQRPARQAAFELDLTYLFDETLDNPDFDRMGEGRMIREGTSNDLLIAESREEKRLRGIETTVEIDHVPRLMRAIIGADPMDARKLELHVEELGIRQVNSVIDIAQEQVGTVQKLEVLIGSTVAREIELHKLIESNLWLIQDGLELWSSDKPLKRILEEHVTKLYKGRINIRPDLICRSRNQGVEAVIIEFKRPRETIVMEHVTQALEYEALLKKHRPNLSFTTYVVGRRYHESVLAAREKLGKACLYLWSMDEILQKARTRIQGFLGVLDR